MAPPVLSPDEKAALDSASQIKLVEALSAYDLSAAGKWFPDAYVALGKVCKTRLEGASLA